MNTAVVRTLGFLAAGLLVSSAAMAGPVELGKNLLGNGGAESGEGSASGNDVLPVPKWQTDGNFTVVLYGAPGFPKQDSPGPPRRGNQFFAGGPGGAESSATQTLDLKPLAAQIDAGKVRATLGGYLGGFSTQEDHADLSVTFYDKDGNKLGRVALKTVTAADRNNVTGMLKRKAAGNVPEGSRSAYVALVMTSVLGAYNDGYADALSLVLKKH